MNRSLKYPGMILMVLLLLQPLAMTAQTTGGSMEGTTIDKSGSPLPGVTVTATNGETGFSRTTVSDSTGRFNLPGLQVGSYAVQATLEGFGTVTVTAVRVNVASTRTLEITLGQTAVAESITVTADSPLVADSPSIGTVVSQKELENLPLNGRQFANLGSLAPGTSLSVNSDPTKPGQLTIALNGGSGRNVNYVIDGGDNTDDTIGGALQNFNLEAVQEFKIQTMQYKAEYGRSSGGVLTVVTKTGTNNLGGSAYGFFRDKSLNEKTHTEDASGASKGDYKRKQFGGSLGGPIVRDRAHFFATYEKLDRDTNYTIDTSGVFPSFDGTSVATPFTDELATAKATANITAAQYLQVRYGYQKNTDTYGPSPLALPSFLGTTTNKYRSLLGGHTWNLASNRLNEFIYQWTKFNNTITANTNDPYLVFPSGVVSGQNPNAPQATNQEKSQFKDDFSWSSTLGGSHHDFKTGVNYVHEPILSGDFTVGTSGEFHLLGNDPNSPVTDIFVNGGFSGQSTPIDQYGIYLQDDWGLTNAITLNLGVRYDYWDGFDIDQGSNRLWQILKTQRKYNEAYLKQFQGAPDKLSNDTNNIAPRLGFTWDVSGNSTRIIRGGVGRFYDFPYTNATILFPASDVQSVFGTVYERHDPNGIRNADGSFFKPGQTLPPGNEAPPLAAPLAGNVASPSITNVPYSDQLSAGYSWEVTSNFGLNVDAVGVWYKDIPFRFRANPSLDANGQPLRNADGNLVRRFAEFGAGNNFRIWQGGGKANYKGLNIGGHVRVASKLQVQGFYTLSKAEGNVLGGADEFRLTGSNFQADMHRLARDASVNSLDPFCHACTGPLFSDARHRITLSAVYDAPFGIVASGIARYRSGLPYTVLAGTDLNNDLFAIDLAPGVSQVNSKRGDSFNQIDVRLSKDFHFAGNSGIELIGEIFNLLNSKNAVNFDRFGNPSSFAGDPGQGEQRLAQLGARIHF
ncbi:MAG: TonB-dependent receptor [Acidobacteriota bacterium]